MMKRRSFSIKGLGKRGRSTKQEDVELADVGRTSAECEPAEKPAAAPANKRGHREKKTKTRTSSSSTAATSVSSASSTSNCSKTSNNSTGSTSSCAAVEDVSRRLAGHSAKTLEDAPPPYSEHDENTLERTDESQREVLISWEDAVKRCVPFSDVAGLQYLRADSSSTIEDDLLYGTSELLNQYEVGWDTEDERSSCVMMDGTASLPARYLSQHGGGYPVRAAFPKVNSVQDLRHLAKMYGASHAVPQYYDLHGRGGPPPSRTLVGEGLPQGNLRRSLPTSYSSRQPTENLLLDLDGPNPRSRHQPRAQIGYDPLGAGRASGGSYGGSYGGRRSPPPREERVANGLRRSTGVGFPSRSRSKYTPAIAVRRDTENTAKGGSRVPPLELAGVRLTGAAASAASAAAAGAEAAGVTTPVGILKRDHADGGAEEALSAATAGRRSVSLSAEPSAAMMKPTSPDCSTKREKAVVFGAYQPKKDTSSLARREAKKAAMKNMNVSRAMEAAATGNIVALQHLLQMKVPGMEFTAVSRDDDQKATVLHRAAQAGQLDCLRFLMGTLLSSDASPQDATTLVDIADRTPAMLALQNGHQDCLEYLLQCGNGDLEIDDHGHTLLHHAAYHGQTQCLQYLIDVARKNGKDIGDFSDDMDVTPAHVAAQQGHIECLRLLVEHELDICQADVDGLTPLDWATKAGQPLCQHYLTMVEKCWDLTDQLEQAQEKLERTSKEVVPLREQLDEAATKKAGLQKMLEQTKTQCEKKIEQTEKECAKALSSFLHLLSAEQQKTLCHQLPTSLLSALSMSQKKLSADILPEKTRSLPRTSSSCAESDPSSPTRSSEGDSSDDRSTSSQNSLSTDSGCGVEAGCSAAEVPAVVLDTAM